MRAEFEHKIIAFWCLDCRIDWKLIAEKRWKNSILGEVWVAECEECGHDMVRLINDAPNDPYFRLSANTQYEVKKYAEYLIQPGHPDFDKLYPWHKKDFEKKKEEEERKIWEQARKIKK